MLVDAYVALVTARFLVLERVHDEGVSPFEGHAAVRTRVLAGDGALRTGLLCGCSLRFQITFDLFRCLNVYRGSLWVSLWGSPRLRLSCTRTLDWMLRRSSPLAWSWSSLKPHSCLMYYSTVWKITTRIKDKSLTDYCCYHLGVTNLHFKP